VQGSNLWKHGRQGKPKVHYFHLTDADTRLTWMSKDTKNRSVRLPEIENVRCARTTLSPPVIEHVFPMTLLSRYETTRLVSYIASMNGVMITPNATAPL